MIDCAVISSTLDHREANASVLKFIYDLLHTGRVDLSWFTVHFSVYNEVHPPFFLGRSKEDKPDFGVRQAILVPIKDEYGPKLLDTWIKAAIFQLPSYTYIDIGDIIYELMSYERTVVCHWLEETLKGNLITQK